jgi:hypothetical protein
LISALTLVLAACGPSTDAGETSTTVDDAAATTTTEVTVLAVLLSYSLESGTSYTYEVSIDQNLEMTAEGDANALGEEEFPGDMAISISGTSTFTHEIADGPEAGTFEVTIRGEFSELTITGTVDGEPTEAAALPELAQIEPVDVTIIVDEQGNIIPGDNEFGDLLGGIEDPLGSLGDFVNPSAGPGQFVGPPFPDKEVTVGDTWSHTITNQMLLGADPVTTEIDSEVTGTDTVDGRDVFVIQTDTVTSPIEFDLAEILLGFFGAWAPDDATDEENAELDALMADLRFLFVIDETPTGLTTWFDAEAGIAVKADFESSTNLTMDINMPDETTGNVVGFLMDMSIDQTVSYLLIDGPKLLRSPAQIRLASGR